jgi:UDP-glucose 4-epimerase
MMKVMVTGGAGFIGSYIVDRLIEDGHEVVVVDNLSTGERENVNPKAHFYEIDILEKAFDYVVEQEAPEVIYHEAALVYVQQSIKNPVADAMANVIGTLKVLKAAKDYKVRKVIYASTCAAYGDVNSGYINEDHSIEPVCFYGASKYMAEIYVRLFYELFGLDYCILRYANVYGPRQKFNGEGGVIPIFINNLIKGVQPVIYGDGEQTRDFVYVKDVAAANIAALNKGARGTFNIGTGIETTVNELYSKICNAMKSNLPLPAI